MEALSRFQAVSAACPPPFSMRGWKSAVKSRRRPISARARGAALDELGQASSSVASRLSAVGIQHRANPSSQVSLPVPCCAFLVTTSLDSVHRHGKSLAFERWMDRWTAQPLRQLLVHGRIFTTAPALFNAHLDGPNFDAQSMLIEIRRGTDATAMQVLTRRPSRPPRPPLAPMRFPAICGLAAGSKLQRIRAPPAPVRAAFGRCRAADATASVSHHTHRRAKKKPPGVVTSRRPLLPAQVDPGLGKHSWPTTGRLPGDAARVKKKSGSRRNNSPPTPSCAIWSATSIGCWG